MARRDQNRRTVGGKSVAQSAQSAVGPTRTLNRSCHRHLDANAEALNIDPARLGLWTVSGYVPVALSAIMDHLPCPPEL